MGSLEGERTDAGAVTSDDSLNVAETAVKSTVESRAGFSRAKATENLSTAAKKPSRDSGSLDLETPQSEETKSPIDAFDARPVPPPRSHKANPSPKRGRKSRPESACAKPESAGNSVPEAGSGLPDKHRSLHIPNTQILEGKKLTKRPNLVISDEMHDYSEIYTPSNEEPKARDQLTGAWGDIEETSSGTTR